MGGGVGAGEFIGIYIPLTIFTLKMKFKAKLRKIGSSQGIYIPLKVITPKKVIASNLSRYELCPKHPGSMKVTCG